MQVKNYMEDLVFERLNEVLEKYKNICTCEKCRYDIAALALNFLPPRYFVTSQGETYARTKSLEQQFNIDILTAISHAVKIVTSHPHHDGKES